MQQILNNKRGTYLEFYPNLDEEWVYARWIDQITLSEVKEGSIAILDCLKKNNLNKILNDNRDLLGHWSEANDWLELEWLPAAIDAGLKKFAHILSHYSYGQLSAKEMQIRMGKNFEMQLFNNVDEAKIWLKKYK